MENLSSVWQSDATRAIVRPIALEDVDQVMGVLSNAAFSNILPAVRVTFRGRGFRVLASAITFVVYTVFGSILSAVLCFMLIVGLVWLFNLLVAVFYSYGPPLQDMRDVKSNYMTDPRTRFWVVEVRGEEGEESDIAACVAIVSELPKSHKKSKKVEDTGKVSYLRRMAVQTEYRGCGFAKMLVQTAIDFCHKNQYDSIDLITTDIHSAARQLYTRMGFKCLGLKLYKYYWGIIRIWTYEYTYDLKKYKNSTVETK